MYATNQQVQKAGKKRPGGEQGVPGHHDVGVSEQRPGGVRAVRHGLPRVRRELHCKDAFTLSLCGLLFVVNN